MRILIIGGGPGGLYAGLLLKKANPNNHIQIFERNPAGATYGWGVVFSDRTLSSFREADFPTYQKITDDFVNWTAIDTYYQGQLLRCDGHSFAGMARQRLLDILQERCRELGVEMRFETEITDFSDFDDFDLVIAADGVNSTIREAYANYFIPNLTEGKAKYIWFGTDKVLDAFTFIFREDKHGLFQVHAYPYDGQMSTFIVECQEAVWQKAGLDQADEASSIQYCEALFADFLNGHRLYSNNSNWINFIIVKNKSWRHENIILLGDAAHTAHFSIGSGTKLAMEDSIALAQAFETSTDLDVALNHYEMERRPRVEILQQAAFDSQTYFENIKRYLHLDPIQFSFHLLTRSGRITYDNLRTRDPFYVDSVDRWFRANTRERTGTVLPLAPSPLFTPFKLRDLYLNNRVVIQPTPTYSAVDGIFGESHKAQFQGAARRGAALVLTEPVAVTPNGRITPGCLGLYTESQLEAWQEAVHAVHQHDGTKITIRLNHAGRRGSTRPRHVGLDLPLKRENWSLMAPSPVPFSPNNQTPQTMQPDDFECVREAFVRAAEMADKAGFDMLQLHFAHGYLLSSFISPLTNKREDDYGGSFENRTRFPLEVLDSVRAVWSPDKPISVAINATDWDTGGGSVDDAVALAISLQKHGCDLVEVLAGQTTPTSISPYEPGFLTRLSDQIRHEAGIPTMVGGYLTTSGEINTLLAGGRADLCIFSPPREPYLSALSIRED